MTKSILLTDLNIKSMVLNYTSQCVIVEYGLVDANGREWQSGEAIFWLTMPQSPPGQEVPTNWFLLPSSYVPLLIQLRDDADNALTNKFLV